MFLFTNFPLTAPTAWKLPPLSCPWKSHPPYDPGKWYSAVSVAKSGRETPVCA